ncbi:hypothetical protein JHK82_030966 [Glycine max]|nr:hypothetical protein JHK85_031611 [Glycine max]KAG5124229.1 hypothetical protein JHK82_030966 [Glycine max]KAG5145649.1 hypothetical protein JHK84_031192 [Glycine max]
MVCGICLGRNQVQRRLLDESIADDPSLQQLQSRGLEFTVVQSLPTFQFKKNEGEQEKAAISVECAICLGEFEEGESVVHHHILQCSVASHTLLQPLRREDFERVQSIHS